MSLSVSNVDVDSRLELSCEQLHLLRELKQWVEVEAEFYGRSENEFLLMFLRSCDFDLELSKKTLDLYYFVRVKHPQWWANRDINNPQVQFLIKERVLTMLFNDAVSDYPPIIILHVAGFGPDSSILGPGGMLATCVADTIAKQTKVQLNGAVFIFDYCLPIKVKMVVLVNAPPFMYAAINFVHSLLPNVYKDKLKCCRSWSDIGKFIPIELLPDEYGGQAGPIQVHEDESIRRFLAMSDYILEDNKYGFQIQRKH